MRQLTQPFRTVWFRRMIGLAVIVLPACLLFGAVESANSQVRSLLWMGIIFQCVATLLAIFAGGHYSDLASWPVIMLYGIALSWLTLGGVGVQPRARMLAQGLLLCVPVWLFLLMCLQQSGALALRRGRVLADRLTRRRKWPADRMRIREMPEVLALRDALTIDASPVFPLLVHHSLEARVAGLAALEYRTSWRPGQPQYLLGLVRNAADPEIKAEGLLALACVDDRTVLEPMAEYLWDESPLVRQAAAEALLWTTDLRWPWIRMAIRQGLAHPVGENDGPVIHEGQVLSAEVVADLTAWTAEKGTLAQRSAQTLALHYAQVLSMGEDASVVQTLQEQLSDPHTPAVWRLEIARLLSQFFTLTPEVARSMLATSNPAPLRLLAIETMMGKGHDSEAIAALIDLARLPNRELALAAAEIVQRRLGEDMGLPRGQRVPPVHSRQAAEIVRNVQMWADRQDGRVSGVGARSHDEY
jgi:hypothetical protein